MQKHIGTLLFAVFAWSLLVLRFGYEYGAGDQVELLPYVLYLNNPSLYPHDFFIQGLAASVPNERTVMAYLLLPSVNHLELVCFLLQFITTIALIVGLEKLTLRFIHNKYIAWLAILAALIPLDDYTLGNVELYSTGIQASSISIAIIVWAINLFLDKKYIVTFILLSIATIIHALEGLDTTLILGAMLLLKTIQRRFPIKILLGCAAIYGLTAGIYLVMILFAKSGASQTGDDAMFRILFQFRHPNHFIFTSFPLHKTIVFIVLAVIALFFYLRKSPLIFQFVIFSLAGILLYAFITDGLHIIPIANFQLYKLSSWIKFFGVVAVFGYIEILFFYRKEFRVPINVERALLIVTSAACLVVAIQFHQLLPYSVPMHLFQHKQQDDVIAICEQIKANTPQDAVFIQPFDNTALKFYGQRSSYVEFKANVKHRNFIPEWYNRIHSVYGVSLDDSEKGFKLQGKADAFFCNLPLTQLRELKSKGVTHLLIKKDCSSPTGKLILSNNTYAVYQL